MNEKRPELQDFGITHEQCENYFRGDPGGRVFFIAFLVGFIPSLYWSYYSIEPPELDTALGHASILALVLLMPIAYAVQFAMTRLYRLRCRKGNIAAQIKLFDEALDAYEQATRVQRLAEVEAERERLEMEHARREADRPRREAERARLEAERTHRRTLREYWMSLDGLEFERELGEVFRRLGYAVESTPRTADEGIDLLLRKDGKTTIVQCKSHKSPVGPAVARELYGSMRAAKADRAILACTGGFTSGVVRFAQGKPMNLISAAELARMGEDVEHTRIAYADKSGPANRPTCPRHGCGERMTLKTGRYGRFWGCPEWPICSGTREYQKP